MVTVTGKNRQESWPTSLAQANMWLAMQQPGLGAPLEDSLAWHELASKVYEAVAKSDPTHQQEALALAGVERSEAVRVTALIAARNAAKPLGGNPP